MSEPEDADDQQWDGTDFAHPAYWRGEEVAVHVLCQQLNEIMDGKPIGSGVASEPWESTRRRVERLVKEFAEECHDADAYYDAARLARNQVARIAELEKQVEELRAASRTT